MKLNKIISNIFRKEEQPCNHCKMDEMVSKIIIEDIARERAGANTFPDDMFDITHLDPLFESVYNFLQGSSIVNIENDIRNRFAIGMSRTSRIVNQLEAKRLIYRLEDGSYFIPKKDEQKEIEHAVSSKEKIKYIEENYSDAIHNRTLFYESEVRRKQENEERRFKEQEREEIDRLKEQLKNRNKKRELEKKAIQELMDEGELFPEANKRPPIPKEVVDAVWRRDGGKCVYCGSTKNLHLDHIIPFSKGGETTVENLQILCRDCNLRKSNKIG